MRNLLFILAFCLTFSVNAASNGVQWGLGVSTFNAELNDPDGQTESSDQFTSFYIVGVTDSGRDNRWFSMINFGSYDIDATTTSIGQSSDFYYVGTTYQSHFRWSRNIKPWFGIGLALTNESFTSRHTVDSGGFLDLSFIDRDEFGASLVVDASHDFQIYKKDFLVRASYLSSTYDGSDIIDVGIYWLF